MRLGLFLYDHLGGRKLLPPSRALDLTQDPAGAPLKAGFRRGFEYSDCWVDDARLVVLNARDAASRGADIRTRTKLVEAERRGGAWGAVLEDTETGAQGRVQARALVNAGGPWANEIIASRLRTHSDRKIRLVRGSHIVVRKLFEHDRCYIFQNPDGRIVFAIPYERDFTLIGTTDRDHADAPSAAVCTPEEADYLCRAASEYFAEPVTPADIVWTYSGVRPLYDDGRGSAAKATRDYTVELDEAAGQAPAIHILGGKITTYRRLAEAALAKLAPCFPAMGGDWTASAALPGGDVPVAEVEDRIAGLQDRYPFLGDRWARRLWRAYGTEAAALLGDASGPADLGRCFGASLTEREVRWLMTREWARTADDVLWRRSKLGLHLSGEEAAALDAWMRGG